MLGSSSMREELFAKMDNLLNAVHFTRGDEPFLQAGDLLFQMPQQDGVVISELVKEGVKDAGQGDAGHSLLFQGIDDIVDDLGVVVDHHQQVGPEVDAHPLAGF